MLGRATGRSEREGPVGSGGPVKAAVRRAAKAVRFASARPTTALRPLPDFLILGAQRSGTTSMYRYLARHPAVAPVLFGKGVHFFDTNFERGLDWYRSHFPTAAYRAVVSRRAGVRAMTGEGSPYYLFHPLAAVRIAEALPAVRVIVMLRDPAGRAYSHYNHERARGFEPLTFEEALLAEAERLRGEEERLIEHPGATSFEHQHHSYIARGMYAGQLRRLGELVPSERVLVVVSEEFYEDPDREYRRALRFLGLPERSLAAYERANSRRYPPMPAPTRALLDERFGQPNRELAHLLGRELPWGAA
jgi:hypothetical protein